MNYKPKQGDIVFIDFDPSKGYEVQKRRPALVMSRNEYNISTNIVIACPITTTLKERPFLIAIESKNLPENFNCKVNTNQVYSLDYSDRANRKNQFIETMEEEQFYIIVQKFMHNFAFKL